MMKRLKRIGHIYSVSATKYQSKDEKKKRVKIDPKSIKVWRPGDKNVPLYDETNYQVAKFAIFQVKYFYP